MPGDKFARLFDSFNGKRVMIIGDVMLDLYLDGKVERISPEAPVPIVAVRRRFARLGGAANVAQNIRALGAVPVLCSVIGDDSKADDFLNMLDEHQMPKDGIVRSTQRRTTTKYRIIGNNAQMLRVDEEDTDNLSDNEYVTLRQKIDGIIDNEKIDGIILQDYNKGVLTEQLIGHVISVANERGIPVGVDPKKNNFLAYRNCTLFKPNLKELKEGISVSFKTDTIDDILVGVSALQERLQCRFVMNTLSERGVIIQERCGDTVRHWHIPAHLRKIADVSGAGDTVLSVAMLCLVCQEDAFNIAAISNLAGGLVCEEIGAVPINKERLLEETERLY
ncbi:MAG: D-glycero-beta-D-manno-heptose-7-phosphate kinase [bacterium]|nr:D-glycero-beta-D-manno-heptose-7-phosphate kinase [Candidatus Limimorpha caballi]MCQ2316767.1 bifunctional ADP-heptose synthase [Bacteroidales bacterium]